MLSLINYFPPKISDKQTYLNVWLLPSIYFSHFPSDEFFIFSSTSWPPLTRPLPRSTINLQPCQQPFTPMDSPETKEELKLEEEQIKKRSSLYIICGTLFRIFFTIWATFFASFLVLFVAVFVGNLSIWSPISVPSQCKIISSSKYFHYLFFTHFL